MRAYLVLLIASLSAVAQPFAPEPEIPGAFYRLDAGQLVPLERRDAAFRNTSTGFMVMTMKTVLEVPGNRSAVRFKTGQPMQFVVRGPMGFPPGAGSRFLLHKLSTTKDKRRMVISSGYVTPVHMSNVRDPSRDTVPVEVSPYGAWSDGFMLVAAPLAAGEYALTMYSGQTLYCFGVD
jgi:hypothetical protein